MNKLSLILIQAALILSAASAFADQAPAAAQVQAAAPQHPASHYLFRGSAFAAAGRIETRR